MAVDTKKRFYISDCETAPACKAGFTHGASIVAGILKIVQPPI
jgi:hypothetical protein